VPCDVVFCILFISFKGQAGMPLSKCFDKDISETAFGAKVPDFLTD
jgi:hypothetical protein